MTFSASRGLAPRMPMSRFFVLFGVGFTVTSLVSPHLFTERKRPVYTPLPLREGSNEIRLLRLQPGAPWMQIRADLRVAPLESSHAPRYTALSYTWDEPIQPSAPLTTLRGLYHHARAWYWRYCRPSHETIVINDVPFPAARNLATALRHLRDGKEPIDFWVDAVCINQEDEAEKSSQVRMMPHIYSQANKTVIWLGTRADGSDEAMDFIHSASSMRTDDPNIDFDKLVPSRALTALFSRAWWSRVWVIQEAILSQQAVVVCGEKVVPLDAFETLQQKARELRETMQSAARSSTRASSQAPGFIPPFMPFTEILSGMGHLRSKCSEERTTWDAALGLAALVMQTSRFQCTLPRDKVYGLFGLFPEVQRVLQPSYDPEKTDVDVFKDVTVFLTRWTNRIDHILFWKKPETDRVRGEASWAIDPVPSSVKSRPFPFPCQIRYFVDGGFWTWVRLTPSDVIRGSVPKSPTTTNSADSFWGRAWQSIKERVVGYVNPEFLADSTVMRLRGLILDTVVAASPSPMQFSLIPWYLLWQVSGPTEINLWAVAVMVHRLKQQIFRWQALLKTHTDGDSKTVTADPYIGTGGRRAAFWRVLMANSIQTSDGGWEVPDDEYIKKVPGFWGRLSREGSPLWSEYWRIFWPLLRYRNREQWMVYSSFPGNCITATTGRSFILTRKGFMGLGPGDAEAGDVVCVVRGSNMPVVLRPVAGKENVYRLLGDCYVHGIMDGEFAKGASRGDVKTLDIE